MFQISSVLFHFKHGNIQISVGYFFKQTILYLNQMSTSTFIENTDVLLTGLVHTG